jgi:hypothetical protein
MDRPSSAMGLVWTLGCTMLPGHCRHPPIHARVIIGELTWEAMRNAGDGAAAMFSDIAAPLLLRVKRERDNQDVRDRRDGRGFEVRRSRLLELRTQNFESRFSHKSRANNEIRPSRGSGRPEPVEGRFTRNGPPPLPSRIIIWGRDGWRTTNCHE